MTAWGKGLGTARIRICALAGPIRLLPADQSSHHAAARGRAGRLAAACALLTVLAGGCASTPLYGPPPPSPPPTPHASASVGLQLFRQAETGPLARAFQADAAAFNHASRDRRVPPPVLGEDAYQVADDLLTWSQAMRQAPVPREYEQAKATLLHGLALLRQGYRHIGDGLLYDEPAQLTQGRGDVRAGSALLGSATADVSL